MNKKFNRNETIERLVNLGYDRDELSVMSDEQLLSELIHYQFRHSPSITEIELPNLEPIPII